MNNEDIYIRLNKVYIPFDITKYNNNYYVIIEMLLDDEENIKLIRKFENRIMDEIMDKRIIGKNDEFDSTLKKKKMTYHFKTMIKKSKKGDGLIYDKELGEKIKDRGDSKEKYEIIIKPEILWRSEEKGNYGITYYLVEVNNIK